MTRTSALTIRCAVGLGVGWGYGMMVCLAVALSITNLPPWGWWLLFSGFVIVLGGWSLGALRALRWARQLSQHEAVTE